MTKQSNPSDQSRRLFLERLERRWMLNAHFDFGSDLSEDRQHDAVGQYDQQPQRSRQSSDQIGHHELQSDAESSEHRRDDHHHSGRHHHSGDQHRMGHGHRVDQHRDRSSELISRPQPQPTEPVFVSIRVAIPDPAPINVIVVLQPSAREPTQVAPVTIPTLATSRPVADISQASTPDVDSDAPEQANSEAGTDSEGRGHASALTDQALLVSFRDNAIREFESNEQAEPLNESSGSNDRQAGQSEDPIVALDHWLSEFSRTNKELSELDATLDALVLNGQQRSTELDDSNPDRASRSRSESGTPIDLDVESSVNEMIWLGPIPQSVGTNDTLLEGWTEPVGAQWSTGSGQFDAGIGWYQSFEFVDQANMRAALAESPAILVATATTSDLVVGPDALAGTERVQISVSRATSFAVVAVGVASWQVLQRRKRRHR